MASIDAWIKRQKDRVEAAERLAEIWRRFPDLVQELVSSLKSADFAEAESKADQVSGAKRPRAKSAQNLERVRSVLAVSPEPLTLQEIADQALLTRSAVRHVIENLFPDEFESATSEKDRRATVWRLKQPSLESTHSASADADNGLDDL